MASPRLRLRLNALHGAAVAGCLWPMAASAETPAGTVVTNIARLTASAAGQPVAVASNEHRLIVAERLDVSLLPVGVATGGNATVATVTLNNRSNGGEAFLLSATTAPDAGTPVRFAIDTDGDGVYDPARDADLADGRTPVLTAGQRVTIFAILPAGASGSVTIAAAAATGAGTPGTGFAGAGDNGGDAVVGRTGARASVTMPLAVTAPTLAKSATVQAPDGSTRAVRGAVITYELVARFPAATEAARVADPIPAGTALVPASLTLDAAPLSDAADRDAGEATAARIAVVLGAQPAGATHTIRFKVTIQ